MIPRKRRTAKQRALLRYKQRARVGIGRTRDQRRRVTRAVLALHIQRTHDQVWARDATCRVTGIAATTDAMHEDPYRSQTRGLPPEARFNLRICLRLSQRVHRLIHDGHLVLTALTSDGFNGPIRWTAWRDIPAGDDRWRWHDSRL